MDSLHCSSMASFYFMAILHCSSIVFFKRNFLVVFSDISTANTGRVL